MQGYISEKAYATEKPTASLKQTEPIHSVLERIALHCTAWDFFRSGAGVYPEKRPQLRAKSREKRLYQHATDRIAPTTQLISLSLTFRYYIATSELPLDETIHHYYARRNRLDRMSINFCKFLFLVKIYFSISYLPFILTIKLFMVGSSSFLLQLHKYIFPISIR